MLLYFNNMQEYLRTLGTLVTVSLFLILVIKNTRKELNRYLEKLINSTSLIRYTSLVVDIIKENELDELSKVMS